MSALHEIIGKRAYELLPKWEQDFWMSELDYIPEYCSYPDLHLACQWDDPSKLPYYEKYCLMPNGDCIPHGPTDAEKKCVAFGNDPDPAQTAYALRYYFERVIELLKEKNAKESAIFAGTLAHLLQDSSVTVHAMNNILINRLFPDRDNRCYFFHSLVDGWPFKPELISHTPQILGRNLDEAVFVATERIFVIVDKVIGMLVPFANSILNGDHSETDRISQQMNTIAVKLTADIWHTLFSIATGKICDAFPKTRALTDGCMVVDYSSKYDRKQYIDAGIPFYPTIYPSSDCCRAKLSINPYPYEPVFGHALTDDGEHIPLELLSNGKRISSEQGIAAGKYCIATFRVPGKIFSKLDVLAGVHPISKAEGKACFGIWCPDCGKPLLAYGAVSKHEDALHFVIDIPENCSEISLLAAGDELFSAIWLNPELTFRN